MPLAPDLLHFELPDESEPPDEPEPPVGPEPPDEPELPDEPEPPDEPELPVGAGLEETITFISGVTSNATVAANSYGAWSAAGQKVDGTLSETLSDATKWGDTRLLPSGNPGNVVKYWFNTDTNPNWSVNEKAAWASALALWSAEVNITFTAVNDKASADFIITRTTTAGASAGFFPQPPGSTIGSSVEAAPKAGSEIDLNSAPDPGVGSITTFDNPFGIHTMLHELGHMLGLGHGGPYNNIPERSTEQIAEEQQLGVFDMQLWALMSYIRPDIEDAKYFASYPVTGTDWNGGQPTTPMMLDILAAQRIYGRPTSGPLVGGNHTFGFNSNLDSSIKDFFDFNVNKNPVITIWDGGFNNTLDLSGWSTPSTINLNPGTFSSANSQINNIGIAFDTIIETAKGGEGSDTIIGNAYPNLLFGNGGNDNLNGGPGNDALTGGLGADRFVLGKISDGVDTFLDFSRIQQDRIALDHAGFGLGSTGTLAQVGVSLVNGSTAQGSVPTILYSAGDVSWDSDGTGASLPTLLAHVLTAEVPSAVANPDAPGPIMVNTAHVFPQLSPDDFVIV